jgi:hypothetical protein
MFLERTVPESLRNPNSEKLARTNSLLPCILRMLFAFHVLLCLFLCFFLLIFRSPALLCLFLMSSAALSVVLLFVFVFLLTDFPLFNFRYLFIHLYSTNCLINFNPFN